MLDLDTFGDVTHSVRTPWQRRALIVFEPIAFVRRLTLDVLRMAGAQSLLPTGCPNEAMSAALETRNPLLVAGWEERGTQGLDLVRRLRASPGPARDAEAILISPRRRSLDIEDARDAGANAYLLRPFSADAVRTRLGEVSSRPARFITTARFKGPDRRKPRSPYAAEPAGYKRGHDVEAGHVTPMQAALNQADDMAFQSMRRGDPIGARVGRSLRRFLEGLDTLTPEAREIIALHRATLGRLDDLKDAEPQVRAELVNGLEVIVSKRKAA